MKNNCMKCKKKLCICQYCRSMNNLQACKDIQFNCDDKDFFITGCIYFYPNMFAKLLKIQSSIETIYEDRDKK